MKSNIIHKLVKFLNLPSRQIYRSDKALYLTRYYVFRRPIKWLPSIYIHCFHNSDEDLELHSHPFNYSLSLLLSGKYREEYLDNNEQASICEVKERILKPGYFNYITHDKFHRVDLLDSEVWTIFISGPKLYTWYFWNRYTKELVHWKEHEERKKVT